MNELLMTIASLCAIHGSSSSASLVEGFQKDCQKKYISCSLTNVKGQVTSNNLSYNLTNCLKDLK
jgi:hypothetical protein